MSLRGRIRTAMLRWFPERITDDLRAQLVAEAQNRLVAGVTMSPSEWEGLSAAEQAAYLVAGERIAAALAAKSGIAGLGIESAAEIMAPADGGALKGAIASERKRIQQRSALEAVAERTAARVASRTHGAA